MREVRFEEQLPLIAPHDTRTQCHARHHHLGLVPDVERQHGFAIRPEAPKPRPDPVFKRDLHLPSLLTNQTLHVHIAQFQFVIPFPGHEFRQYDTVVFVNGQKVLIPDLPTRNGALHVLKRVIHPLKHREPPETDDDVFDNEDEDWDDWEEWLPAWANED